MTRTELVEAMDTACDAENDAFEILYPYIEQFEEGATTARAYEIHQLWDAWDAATAVHEAAIRALNDFDAAGKLAGWPRY